MKRLSHPSLLHLIVAIQGVLLLVMGVVLSPAGSFQTSSKTAAVGGITATPAEPLTSVSELPRDLQRERLPIPRFPDREKSDEPPQPTPTDDGVATPGNEGSALASLRVSNVALTGPVAIAISAPVPSAPDSLDGQSLASGAWLGGRSRGRGRAASPAGGLGGGGGGMGGGLGGGGGACPAPGRIGGGGLAGPTGRVRQ